MEGNHTDTKESTGEFYGCLETYARQHLQAWLQDLLEQEVTEVLGRRKHERKRPGRAQAGDRNGHGKSRRFTFRLGTVEVRRPRVRNLDERFVSRVLPLFKRQSREVRQLLPDLYLHGLASGDFELALRGLLGEGAPLSASSLRRLKEKWAADMSSGATLPWKKGSSFISGQMAFLSKPGSAKRSLPC